MYAFDQLIGIYYVQLPIRMTVLSLSTGGLLVYAPVAPTAECLDLMSSLVREHGRVKYIILPSVAVEHKVNAGPFARAFPDAEFYAVDEQYSFPVPLPPSFLGLPSWTKPLPPSSRVWDAPWSSDFDYSVLTVKPGPASAYQDAAFYHRPSSTLLVCDAVFSVYPQPPAILTDVPEYRKALLFHARDNGKVSQVVEDNEENRIKGWERIVLLFNFFFPGSASVDLGLAPLTKLDLTFPYGWGGWQPVEWKGTEHAAFEAFRSGGKPTVLPIIQIILSRGGDGGAARAWVDEVCGWKFDRVVPQHLDAVLDVGPAGFREAFDFAFEGENRVRFCDEDARFLREAEEGFLSFSVYKSKLGTLRGKQGCQL